MKQSSSVVSVEDQGQQMQLEDVKKGTKPHIVDE